MKRINANCVQVNSDRKSVRRVPRRENPNPVYFYYTRSSAEPERGEPEGVLRSIVKQMACLQPGEAVLDPVLEVYEARVKNSFAAGPLGEGECTDLIIQLSHY